MTPQTYLVTWRLPAGLTPIQRLVARLDTIAETEVHALVRLAHVARLEADLADEKGRYVGRVGPDMVAVLGVGP